MQNKTLYRSKTNKMIMGVCGGLGDYTGIDPTVWRIIAVVLLIVTALLPGFIAYIVMGLIIPEEPN